MDTPIVVTIFMIAVIGMAVGIMSYTAGMTRDRQNLGEARYAVTIMREIAGQIRSLAFEGQTSTTISYRFDYGRFQIVDGGSTTITLRANGEEQSLLSVQHSLLRYAGPYSMYGDIVYDGAGEDASYFTSPFQTILIYNCGGSSCNGQTSYSYTVLDPRVYVSNQTSGNILSIQVYVFVLSPEPGAPNNLSPAAGQMILTGSTDQSLATYNIMYENQTADLNINVGDTPHGTLSFPVSMGDTVQVTVNIITATVSFISSA